MLVEKKGEDEIFALKSIRKEDVIEKDQVEHTMTEKLILQNVNLKYIIIFYCYNLI